MIGVGITTYGRPAAYHRTLAVLMDTGTPMVVYVRQDGGERYVHDFRVGEHFRVETDRAPVNFGKKRYWQTVKRLWGLVPKAEDITIWIQLPDDFEYKDGWLDQALKKFESLPTSKTRGRVMNLLTDHRMETGNWGLKPRLISSSLYDSCFVDGAFMADRAAMDKTGWTIQPIEEDRWDDNEELGSGVWSQVTRTWMRRKIPIYCWKNRYITTDWSSEKSVMNPSRDDDKIIRGTSRSVPTKRARKRSYRKGMGSRRFL